MVPCDNWFIDREAGYRRLIRHFSTAAALKPWIKPDPDTFTSPSLFGMPLYNWRSEDVETRIKDVIQGSDPEYRDHFRRLFEEGRLFPLREPGIWVEMSDGNHRQLTFDQSPPSD